MNVLLTLPILIPFLTAILALLVWRHRQVQRILNMLGATSLFVATLILLRDVWNNGIHAIQIGNWPAPFGITLVADLLSAIMVMMCGLMGFAVAIYSLASIDKRRESFGYYPLFHTLLMGVNGAFLTGDMFNLFVWFEVLLISSFVLLALGGEREQLQGAIIYVTLNLLSSALFLAAVGILYGIFGTLNMADLALLLQSTPNPTLTTTLAMLFFCSFGIKAALFPFFFWLPASYHTPPVPVTTIFSALLTKVGIYALLRVFTLLFVQEVAYTHTIILVIAGLTMIVGVLGAVAQYDMRKLLAFHIVSQIGYLLMGIGLLTSLALTGTIFFMVHVIIAKSALFLIGGLINRLQGTFDLKKLGGIYQRSGWFSLLFLLPAFALAGLPPFSGFWAKFLLVRAALEQQSFSIVAAALGVSVLTLFSMTKIWAEAFWKQAPTDTAPATDGPGLLVSSPRAMLAPIIVLAFLTLFMGVVATPFVELASQAAEQLLHPEQYIHAVLPAEHIQAMAP